MNLVLDACTIINLINGQVLHKIAQLVGYTLYVSDNLIEQELLNQPQKILAETLMIKKSVTLIQSDVTLSEFILLKERYKLGDGETECIAICKKKNYCIATDDRKARASAINELGQTKVVGSLYLLREAVRTNIFSCTDAVNAYNCMKQKGGFLPDVNEEYLCGE